MIWIGIGILLSSVLLTSVLVRARRGWDDQWYHEVVALSAMVLVLDAVGSDDSQAVRSMKSCHRKSVGSSFRSFAQGQSEVNESCLKVLVKSQ